ncbi:MAG: ferrous iron transport protein B [Thermodesulfobacteriota bacterium]
MHGHGSEKENPKDDARRLVLVGNPNVGKSVFFGVLTGKYATVSNYPGTTVEVSRGTAWIKDERVRVVDSPGINSLVPTSEDERVTRDILLTEDVDSVLQVVDSKNLRRGLLVTVQLLEMGLPVIVALNMYDEAGQRGIHLDTEGLEKELGLEAVPTIATQRWGVEKVKERVFKSQGSKTDLRYPAFIEQGLGEIEALLPECRISKRSVAVMLLSGDATLDNWLYENVDPAGVEMIGEIRSRIEGRYSQPVGYVINRERLRAADNIVRKVMREEPFTGGRVTEFLGRVSMHPVWGLGVLAVVLTFMYEFVGVFGAGTSVDFLESVVFGEYLNPWVTRVAEALIPWQILQDLLVGPYGVVTMALTYAVAIVLPIVGYFFIFFSFLEDSGYLPRLAIMVDRVFRMMGLNGKAVLPMVLGLGCATMATMTTRILETKKERVIVTLLLALGVPCSAQLGVILGMLGSVSFTAMLWWAGVVVGVLFIVAYLASRVLPGETSDFILEIPPIRMPQLSNIALKTMVRVEWYLKEAVPLFVLGTLVLFVLDRLDLLKAIEVLAAPVIVGLLDLPSKATEAFLIGFLRRDYGAAGLFALQKDGLLDNIQIVVSLVTMTLFVPCIANFFMIVKERGIKAAFWMAAFIFPFALLVGAVLNQVLRSLKVSL